MYMYIMARNLYPQINSPLPFLPHPPQVTCPPEERPGTHCLHLSIISRILGDSWSNKYLPYIKYIYEPCTPYSTYLVKRVLASFFSSLLWFCGHFLWIRFHAGLRMHPKHNKHNMKRTWMTTLFLPLHLREFMFGLQWRGVLVCMCKPRSSQLICRLTASQLVASLPTR